MAAGNSGEFKRAFRGAVQYALDIGFAEILELKPVQEEAWINYFVKRKDVFAVLPIECVSEYLHGQGFGAILSCCLSIKRSNCFKSLKITAYLPVRLLTRTLFRCTCHRQYFVRASAHL